MRSTQQQYEIEIQNLVDDLTKGFINYQHRLDFTIADGTETKDFIMFRYRNDPVFRSKVDTMVSIAMSTLDKHVRHLE